MTLSSVLRTSTALRWESPSVQLQLLKEDDTTGQQVIIHSGTNFQVADHDFTRFSIIPSVALIVDTPDSISGSWYTGNVHVLYKDSAFEPSSPI